MCDQSVVIRPTAMTDDGRVLEIIQRGEARALGLKTYFTFKPCPRGHIAEKYTKAGRCVVCSCADTKTRYWADPEAWNERERNKVKTPEQIERRKQTRAAWYDANPDYDKKHFKVRYSTDPDFRVATLETGKRWVERNRDHKNAMNCERSARRRTSTPKWLTKEQRNQLRAFYELKSELNRTSEDKYSVDHIVPLAGENVCGLHVPWNLRIITQSENSAKKNRFDESLALTYPISSIPLQSDLQASE